MVKTTTDIGLMYSEYTDAIERGDVDFVKRFQNMPDLWFSQSEYDLLRQDTMDECLRINKESLDLLRKDIEKLLPETKVLINISWLKIQLDEVFSAHNGLVKADAVNVVGEGLNPSKPDFKMCNPDFPDRNIEFKS